MAAGSRNKRSQDAVFDDDWNELLRRIAITSIKSRKPLLTFVYNADSGFWSRALDLAHKVLAPQTYACRLCELTHSAMGMREGWRQFLDGLDVGVEFLHKDEFDSQNGLQMPVIFVKLADGSGRRVLVNAAEIAEQETLQELQDLISSRLQQIAGSVNNMQNGDSEAG